MTDFVLEMRIRVPVDLEELEECKAELRERVADLDSRPSFVTAQSWLFGAVESLSRPTGELHRGASDWLPGTKGP